MEIELGLKITHTRDDATSSTEFRFAKDNGGPLFFSRETATMFILIAYLRGFQRENIEIKISEDGKQLTIGGKKPVQEITFRGWMMHKKDEIREFKKVFLIPDGVNLNRTKAKFNNEESTLRITMPKLVKGICGIEIQEVTEEHKERPEVAVPEDDQAHGKTLEEGAESKIEKKEKINDVEEEEVDTVPFENDSQVEQGGVRGCESVTPATVDNFSQTDGTPMEKVEATVMSEKEKSDHAADQALDAFQGDEHNQLEQDEFQCDKQDQVEEALDELQSDKHDQVNQRDVSRSEPKALPVVKDETSHKGGMSAEEDAESVMENKMDQMVKEQHDEADQQSDLCRRELQIPQAMIDETTQKDAKFPERDAESMMPSILDESVDQPQCDKADKVQLSEVSRYEPKMSQVEIDENVERDIGLAQSDKVKKNQLWELEIPEAMIDETQKNDGKPLERGLGNMMQRKGDQIEKHLNDENQSDKVDHSEQMEIGSNEPKVPQVMVGIAPQVTDNSQEDGAELMTESKEKKMNQSAEQVVDGKQYEKSSQKDSSSTDEVEAPTMRKQEKTDHVVDQAFAEIQGNEFPGEKQDQVGPSFDKFKIDKQDLMNQTDVRSGEPEASLVVTDETSQKVEKSLEEDVESMMERGKDQLVESRHDESDKVRWREVSRCELEILQAMIDETAQKDVKSREEDAESMMPSKTDQMVDKPQHDEADQLKPRNVCRDEPVMQQATVDEAIANDIGKTLGDKVDPAPHREVCRRELEMQETMIDETVQEDGKPLEEGEESMMKIKETIDQVDLVEHAEQSEVSRNEPEVSEDTVDEISRKEPDLPEAMVDLASGKEEKSYEDGTELMAEIEEKKTDQVVDARQYDMADHAEKCKGETFVEEVAQPMTKRKKKIDWVDEYADDDQQSDKVDYAAHTEVGKYEPEVPEAMVDATSQKEKKSLKESRELMTGNKEEKPDEVEEQVVDEHQHAKAGHVEKREISWLEYEMPAFPVDETSPEDGKFLQEAAEMMTKNKKKNLQVMENVFDEPQCDQTDHARQRAVSRCEPKMPSAIIGDTSGKDVLSQEAVMEFVKQAIDEPVPDTDTSQVEKMEAGTCKNEMPDVVVDETSLKDDNSQEKDEAMIKSKERIDQVAEKDVDQDKTGVVDEAQRELESRKLIPEEKSKEPENKGSKSSAEEKLSETEPTEKQAISEVMPQTIASTQSEEATPEKKEVPASFLETISRESLETHQAGQEKVTTLEPEVARGTVDMAPEKAKQLIEETTKQKLGEEERSEAFMEERQLNEVDKISEIFPEIDSNKLVPREKSKFLMAEEKERPERTVEEKIDQEAQTIVPLQQEEATPEKAESPITSYPEMPVPEFEPLKADHEVAKTIDDTTPRKDEMFEETKRTEIEREEVHVKPETEGRKLVSEEKCEKPDSEVGEETESPGEEKHDQTKEMEDFTHRGYPEATVEFKKEKQDNDLKPEVAKTAADEQPKNDKVRPEKLVGEKLHEKEFKGMEGISQLVPQIATSKQLEENSLDADKHPVSSESYPETVTPQVENSKAHHVERKDVSKQKPEVGKVLVDEQPEKDKESVDEITETMRKRKEGIDQVERQWQLTEIEKAAETSAEMDHSKPITMEELEKPKLEMKEKTVEEKLDEGPKKINLVPQTIVARQTEEDSPKNPKMTSDSDASESHHDGEEETTEWEPEVVKDEVEEAPKKEEELFQETRKPNIKIEEGIDQAVVYVAEEVPKKEETFQEITKPKIKMEEESGQAMKHVADDLVVNEFEGASAVSSDVDHRTLLPEESSVKSILEMKEESGKRKEKVDEEESNTMEEATGVVPEITTGVKLEEFHPGVKEYPVISPSYQEIPRLGPDISDTRQDWQTEVSKWESESVKSATDKMRQKDKSSPELADSQIKSENIRDQVAEVVLEDSLKMDIGQPTPENTSQIPKIEDFEEAKRTEEENVDEGESKTEEDAIIVTETEPDSILTMQSEEASAEGEEYPNSLASYSGSRPQESDNAKGVPFGEEKVRGQDSELARFPPGDALEKDEELAEEISELEMESKQEIDQKKEIIEVSPETDVSKSVLKKIDEEPKTEMKEETEKLADENADKGELKKKKDAAGTVPQITATVKEEEAARRKEERHVIPAFCPTPRPSKSTASAIHQAEEKRVGEWEPKITTVVAEEVSEKDDKTAKSGRKDQEESVHVMEHMRGDLQFENVEAVTGGSHELDDEKLISGEKSEKSEIDTGKETKGAVEEKVDEKVSDDIRDVPEVAPEVVASLKLEEATHQKEEPHARLDSYPETRENPEAPETQLVSKEVSELEPRTIVTMAEGTPRTYEQSSEEETKPGHAVDERKLKDLAEAVEVSPEMDSIKPMVEEKFRDSETEITEETAEKTIEKKAGEREIKELHGLTGEVPETIESTKLDGATPTEDKLPATTSYSDTQISDPEVSEHDLIGKQEIMVDASSNEVKGSQEETQEPKIKSKEECDHVAGHAADEWQFKKVEDVTEVSPTLDSSNQMMSEKKFEKPDIKIKEETEKAMDEKVDEEETRKLQYVTELVAEIPATTFRVGEPPFREVTKTSGVKSEKEIEQQEMTEPITQQSQREEFLHLKQPEKHVLPAARSLMEEEAQQPRSIDLADVTDQVTQPEEPNVAGSQPMKGKTLPEPKKQEHKTSVEGTMRPQPDKVTEQVEAPVLTVKPQEDVSSGHNKDDGLGDEHKTEKQEATVEVFMKPDQGKEKIETPPRVAQIQEYVDHQQDKDYGTRNEIEAGKLPQGTSVQTPMKPKTDEENEQVERPMLADESPQDKDHRQGSAAAPEQLDLRLNIEGQSKPPSDQGREPIERPLPADEFQSDRDRIPDEDRGLDHDTKEAKKPEPGQDKEQVETSTLADELPRYGDQGQGSETTPEKQEFSMSFEGYMEIVPDKEKEQVQMPLVADELQSKGGYMPDEDHGLENAIESVKRKNEMSFEGPMEPKFDQEKERVDAPVLAVELPQGRDDRKGSETAAERQEIGMSFEERTESAARDKKKQQLDTPLVGDKLENHAENEEHEGGNVGSENILAEMFEGAMEHEVNQKIEQGIVADEPVQSYGGRQDEVDGLYREIESEKMGTSVIPEGAMRAESDKEEEQVETADKQGKDKGGRRKAQVHQVEKKTEELDDEAETEEVGNQETETQRDLRIEQSSRKMSIECKLRSFLFFAGSTFLLPLMVIAMKKSLIEFKSKKR